MSNWAALQESLVGLPVAKRAKHGIHFKQADGSILANFVGKPCHYLDGGIYKPIDTKPVLRKDGWFGCPHSDVIIHPDGTVKVGTYQQKASLISASESKVDGDRIARPFSGGVQYLYITEDGFRQEIVLKKMPDLKQASALLDTVSGVLPTKYKASALSVKDSTTAELADSVVLADAKVLATYLENAKYPVVIDPDFAAGSNNKRIFGISDTYATARSTSSGSDDEWLTIGQQKSGSTFYIYRHFVSFDTSSIGAGSTVTQVNLKLTVAYMPTTPAQDLQIVKQDWSSGTQEQHYDGCLAGTADDAILGNTGSGTWSDGTQKTSGNLNTAWVSKTGTTYYSLRSSRDYDGTENSGDEWGYFYPQKNGTVGYRPVLTVAYTEAAAAAHRLALLGVGK